MKTAIRIRAWSVVLALLAGAVSAGAASFSAEMVDTLAGETHTVPFAFRDGSYRFELIASGQTLVVLADGRSGVVRALISSEKQYVESGPDEPRSWLTSPFSLYAHHARAHQERTEGAENIDGIPCSRRVAFSGEQVYATAWFSAEYGFPLKVEVPILRRTVELRHVKPGPQDESQFAVPTGYQPAPKEDEEPPPPWAAQIPGAPVLTPPFEKTASEGTIVRMRPQAGREIRVRGTNNSQATCAFTSLGFKKGRPLGDVSGNTMNLEPGQELTMTFQKGPAEVDDLVIHVRNGTVTLQAEFIAAGGGAERPVATASDVPAELQAPAAADMASRLEVAWSGPGAKDDYVALARPDHPPARYVSMARIRDGNPAKLWAPSEPGEFEIRYVLAQGGKVLAKIPITINAVTATVSAAGPAKVAGWIEVTWTGPAAEGDFIAVARREQPGYLERTATKQGNPVKVRAPGNPGDYEVRYVLGRGAKSLAKAPVTIEDVAATLTIVNPLKAGADFEVNWSGPGYPEDLIVLGHPGQTSGAGLISKSTRAGNPLKLRAPAEPGDYEVRYILGRGRRALATTTITVTP